MNTGTGGAPNGNDPNDPNQNAKFRKIAEEGAGSVLGKMIEWNENVATASEISRLMAQVWGVYNHRADETNK